MSVVTRSTTPTATAACWSIEALQGGKDAADLANPFAISWNEAVLPACCGQKTASGPRIPVNSRASHASDVNADAEAVSQGGRLRDVAMGSGS